MTTRLRLLAALLVVTAVLSTSAPALGDSVGDKRREAARVADQLEALEMKGSELAEQYNEAVFALDEATAALDDATAGLAESEARLAGLRDRVSVFALRSYVFSGQGSGVAGLVAGDSFVNVAAQRQGYAPVALGEQLEVTQALKATTEDAERQRSAVAAQRKRAEQLVTAVATKREQIERATVEAERVLQRVQGELAVALEEERARREAEQLAAAQAAIRAAQEAAAREAEEAARRAAEQAAAEQAAAEQAAAEQAAAQQQTTAAQAAAEQAAAAQVAAEQAAAAAEQAAREREAAEREAAERAAQQQTTAAPATAPQRTRVRPAAPGGEAAPAPVPVTAAPPTEPPVAAAPATNPPATPAPTDPPTTAPRPAPTVPQPPSGSGGGAPAVHPGAGRVVQAALSQLGVRYVFGASSPGRAFDCSGLTMWAWGTVGVRMPHLARKQVALFPKVRLADIQPGDLVWYPGHIQMYVGNGKVIHAPSPGTVVKLAPLRTNRSGLVIARPQ